VSPKLREKVLNAIRELNYQPNAAARTLRTSKSGTVGIIVPDISDPFFPSLVRGAEDALAQGGYTVLIGNSDNDTRREQAYVSAFLGQQVDGLVMVASTDWAPEYVRNSATSGIPIVYADRGYLDIEGDVVTADNVGASKMAVEHMLDQGFRAIATIAGPRRLANARGRVEGYERALRSRGVASRPEWICEGDFTADSGFTQMQHLLELPNRPDSVFVANALMTLGAFKALQEAGLRIPDQMGLLSFDEQQWFTAVHLAISAIGEHSYQLGATAGQMLLDRIDGVVEKSRVVRLLEGKLLARGSTLRLQAVPNSLLLADSAAVALPLVTGGDRVESV
jgi:LacI family transcriptional regulator